MRRQIRDIREFQEKIAEVKEYSLSQLHGLDYNERVALRNRLLSEEVAELEKALSEKNKVEVLDAGVDVLYILLGTMHEYGLLDKFEKAWDLVHENNLTKLDENGKVLKNEFGKVIKPANYKPVDLKQLFKEGKPTKLVKLGLTGCAPCILVDNVLKEYDKLPVESHIAYEVPHLVKKYNERKFPVLAFEDKDGNVLYKIVGALKLEELNRITDELIRNSEDK